MNGTDEPTEAELRDELGIPQDAEQVLILSQSSHLDWDWLLPFPTLFDNQGDSKGYFGSGCAPAADIFQQAGALLCPNGTPNPHYFYSICEIGFLQAFAAGYPDDFQLLKQAGANLRIVGGGITSPDNLLPHGECFIRNYLLGAVWLATHLPGLPLRQAWLPDDFGHDPQLPVLLEALGLQGVGFSRVPGDRSPQTSCHSVPVDGSPSVADQLTKSGVDFIWEAADGSTTIAHWMQDTYCQGDNINNNNDPVKQIGNYIQTNGPSSPTPYIYVPIGCDFRTPQDVPSFADEWNKQTPPPTVYAVAATFDHYIQFLRARQRQVTDSLPRHGMDANPYFTGSYATRPLLKRLHYESTQALLGAEVFGVVANLPAFPDAAQWTAAMRDQAAALMDGWNQLVPSTHHDYITGTAISDVYLQEQVPLLAQAHETATGLRRRAINVVAREIAAQPGSGEIPVAIFNQLGFARQGLVELAPGAVQGVAAGGVQSVRGGAASLVQPTAEGGLLFMAMADSLGYSTAYLSSAPTQEEQLVAIKPISDGDGYVLSNALVSVTIGSAANWGIAAICDLQSADPERSLLSGTGNDLHIYGDNGAWQLGGNNYVFGNESNEGHLTSMSATWTAPSVQVLETGPLRVRVATKGTYTEPVTGQPFVFRREYLLVAGEPFLRMRTTGRAPFAPDNTGYSVMVEFPLADGGEGISHVIHGTTYHWDDTPPIRYWSDGPAFEATHDFVIAQSSSAVLGAIYHGGVPAWGQNAAPAAQSTNNTLVGCLFRNLTGSDFSRFGNPPLITVPPNGIDPDEHTLEYAFRVPSGLTPAETGLPLREALTYHTPLIAAAVPPAISQPLPEHFSLASVTAAGPAQPILTAAKPGTGDPTQLILRVYQPTDAPMPITLTLADLGPRPDGSGRLMGRRVTALEGEIAGEEERAFEGGQFAWTAMRALTTLAIRNGS